MFKKGFFCDIIQGMKSRIFILSSLLCLCGMAPVVASECDGEGCYFITEAADITANEVPSAPVEQTQYIFLEPMRQAKLLSIKPVPADDRPPLWDGSNEEYQIRGYDKTVDWRDGVPIWDDSVSNYKQKDYSDWFLEPLPEIYIRDSDDINVIDLYNQNMADAAATRARVEELLTPQKPSDNLWTTDKESEQVASETQTSMPLPRPEYVAQDLTELVTVTFGQNDGCPFETETECEIWRRKPIVRETVSPRSPRIRADKMNEFISAARCDESITANNPLAAPLLERYKMLMSSANACCTDGMAYALKQAGATDGLVYKFLSDDANFYGFGARCLMMTDNE